MLEPLKFVKAQHNWLDIGLIKKIKSLKASTKLGVFADLKFIVGNRL